MWENVLTNSSRSKVHIMLFPIKVLAEWNDDRVTTKMRGKGFTFLNWLPLCRTSQTYDWEIHCFPIELGMAIQASCTNQALTSISWVGSRQICGLKKCWSVQDRHNNLPQEMWCEGQMLNFSKLTSPISAKVTTKVDCTCNSSAQSNVKHTAL